MKRLTKQSSEIPEIYKRIQHYFPGAKWEDGLIIAYDDTIYCKDDLEGQKIVHEAVHLRQQQEMGVENWWNLYFEDVEFRLKQEIEAYRAEVKHIRTYEKDRNRKVRMYHKIYLDLSGAMYGNIISYEQAKLVLN